MRRGNILEGKRKRKERSHFTEKKEGKKIRKEERREKEQEEGREKKACRGSHNNAAGCGGLSFHYSRGLAYQGIIGGIACRVWVNG